MSFDRKAAEARFDKAYDKTLAAKAQPNEHGVTWSPSKSGRIQIAVGPDQPGIGRFTGMTIVKVWAIYTGTHDVVTGSTFTGPQRDADARDYANELWATR
jgi:hypothetical protein